MMNASQHDPVSDTDAAEDVDITSEDLVEEVSIDGMCGVY